MACWRASRSLVGVGAEQPFRTKGPFNATQLHACVRSSPRPARTRQPAFRCPDGGSRTVSRNTGLGSADWVRYADDMPALRRALELEQRSGSGPRDWARVGTITEQASSCNLELGPSAVRVPVHRRSLRVAFANDSGASQSDHARCSR
jgi:hypothetical protein